MKLIVSLDDWIPELELEKVRSAISMINFVAEVEVMDQKESVTPKRKSNLEILLEIISDAQELAQNLSGTHEAKLLNLNFPKESEKR